MKDHLVDFRLLLPPMTPREWGPNLMTPNGEPICSHDPRSTVAKASGPREARTCPTLPCAMAPDPYTKGGSLR